MRKGMNTRWGSSAAMVGFVLAVGGMVKFVVDELHLAAQFSLSDRDGQSSMSVGALTGTYRPASTYQQLLDGIYEVASPEVKAAIEADYRAAMADGLVSEDEVEMVRQAVARVPLPDSEISPQAYSEIQEMVERLPSIEPEVREAMADGLMTTTEYRHVVELTMAERPPARSENPKEVLRAFIGRKEGDAAGTAGALK